jgi:hypothetical protein
MDGTVSAVRRRPRPVATKRRPSLVLLACALLAGAALHGADGQPSALWGKDGEAWSPTSRLPDFSLAGYRCGRAAIPVYPVVTDVRAHGAKGDGVSDDTAAFAAALAAATVHGAVLVPAGRYLIGDVVELTRSGVVLRGEGSERSILVVPKPLSALHPHASNEGDKAYYAFSGGFLAMKGHDTGKPLGAIAAAAARGDRTLTLAAAPAGLVPGAWIRLIMHDPADHTLLRHLHGDLLDAGVDTLKSTTPVDWAAQVVAVDGARLTIDRPLRLDVRLEWKPEIAAMQPTLSESGIEALGFEFPGVAKKPHLKEDGYNAIQLTGAVDCWIRDVAVVDGDNGVISNGSRFCTIDGFATRAVKRTGITGHHALWASGRTQDCLFTAFRCTTTYVHDLSVEGFASGNVFTKGSGVSIDCDHHRNAPYENLFTDFDAGDGKRLYESSGRGDRGPHSGARTTFWGVRASGKLPALPPATMFPLLNVIGFGAYPPQRAADGPWVESCGGAVVPANLFEAQRRRLAGQGR